MEFIAGIINRLHGIYYCNNFYFEYLDFSWILQGNFRFFLSIIV